MLVGILLITMVLAGTLAQQLITFTLVTVAASIVLHGISVTPLMRRYLQRRHKR